MIILKMLLALWSTEKNSYRTVARKRRRHRCSGQESGRSTKYWTYSYCTTRKFTSMSVPNSVETMTFWELADRRCRRERFFSCTTPCQSDFGQVTHSLGASDSVKLWWRWQDDTRGTVVMVQVQAVYDLVSFATISTVQANHSCSFYIQGSKHSVSRVKEPVCLTGQANIWKLEMVSAVMHTCEPALWNL